MLQENITDQTDTERARELPGAGNEEENVQVDGFRRLGEKWTGAHSRELSMCQDLPEVLRAGAGFWQGRCTSGPCEAKPWTAALCMKQSTAKSCPVAKTKNRKIPATGLGKGSKIHSGPRARKITHKNWNSRQVKIHYFYGEGTSRLEKNRKTSSSDTWRTPGCSERETTCREASIAGACDPLMKRC